MTIDKQKLMALAEASPYKDWSLSSYEAVGGRAHIVMHGAFDHIITTFEEGSAEFIAAASPATVLALLAEIDRLRDSYEQVCGNYNRVSFASDERGKQIDQLKAENEALRKQVGDDERKLDALLAHCDDGECPTCAQIICPHGGAMHFHHDGCPTCAAHEEAMAKEPSHG